MFQLIEKDGFPGDPKRHALPNGAFVLGRGQQANLSFQSNAPDISRAHARVDVQAGEATLTDTSRNGTQINGQKITQPTLLKAGDIIEIGPYKLAFAAAPPEAAEATLLNVDADETMMMQRETELFLEVQNPDQHVPAARHPLQFGSNTIGRGELNTIRWTDARVSRQHASIMVSDTKELILESFGNNGVLLEGVRIENNKQVTIQQGATLGFGPYTAVITGLQRAQPSRVTSQPREGGQPPPKKSSNLLGLAAGIVLVLGGVGGGAWWHFNPSAPPAPSSQVASAPPSMASRSVSLGGLMSAKATPPPSKAMLRRHQEKQRLHDVQEGIFASIQQIRQLQNDRENAASNATRLAALTAQLKKLRAEEQQQRQKVVPVFP